MTMTTASVTVTAQQIRDRLLQATDAHCNETRLGKLINDLRKKTRDEDLAKRAKKLLRNWQKLIDPHQPEILPKELSSTLNSVMGSNRSQPLPGSRSPQSATDNDKKPVLHSVRSSSTEKFYPMTHTGKQIVEKNLPTLKGTKRSALSTASGSSGGPDDLQIHSSAIKPHFSSPELNKEPTASAVLRKSVLQQQGQRDITAVEKVKHKSHSHYTNPSPRSVKQLVPSKQPTSISATDSEALSALPLHSSIQGMHTECHQSKDPSQPENESLLNSEKTLEQTNNLQNKSKARPQPGLLSEVTNMETEKDIKPSDGKRRKPQFRDYSINVEGRSTDDMCKPARVKNRKLTFDPLTQQIRPSAVNQSEEQHSSVVDVNEPANLKQSPSASSPNALHKMNWKDMSQNQIVKYYLNLQNNLLKTSGSQVPGAHFFMTEHVKCEEDNMREASKTYVQVPNVSESNLPGIDRDITTDDVHKINNKHWPGVNGCYDSKGHWYGWTECISLDTYGDGSKLNILPYVCMD
ncbi:mediator of RNA polymerase II transcription subunit 26 isoform X2 [Ictalurus punctatus]|uniref:Mediator of RNA polymerase II transcription subunit 26 n=1 Tax=Ictalurus punctatus TaxID=7998 RepID=A0A2D0RW87_ICTPU|nr:mediator of RNA polymerase II transcription subunit 26 isoform X2 [Ictalurus punctatus]